MNMTTVTEIPIAARRRTNALRLCAWAWSSAMLAVFTGELCGRWLTGSVPWVFGDIALFMMVTQIVLADAMQVQMTALHSELIEIEYLQSCPPEQAKTKATA